MRACLVTRILLIMVLSLCVSPTALAEQKTDPNERTPTSPSTSSLTILPLKNPESATSWDVWYKTKGIVSGPPAPSLSSDDYPKLNLPNPFGESRLIIWILAQQHVYWGSFVLGVLLLTTYFEIKGVVLQNTRYVNLVHKVIRPIVFALSIIAILGGIFPFSLEIFLSGIVSGLLLLTIYWDLKGLVAQSTRYDNVAYQMLRLILLSLSVTAILGLIFLLSLFYLYPGLTKYLMGLFRPLFFLYGLFALILTVSVYVYYYTWQQMTIGSSKWTHISLGVVVNAIGTTMMFAANAWSSFMMAPAGIDSVGHFLGDYWHVINTSIWPQIDVFRLLGNIVFGCSIVAAYASYRLFTAKTDEERANYDRMSYAAMYAGMYVLIALPFAGYWLMREVYAYRQQMGITLMGGLLAWLVVIQAVMIGSILLTNYYLWQALERMSGAERYQKYTQYIKIVMVACFIVWLWPHMLMPADLSASGQTITGNGSVMSAKNSAINIILTTTWLSIILYKRGNKVPIVKWAPLGNAILFGLFAAAYLNIIGLAVYGYFLPANIRVGLSVPQVASTLSCLVIGVSLNSRMLVGAKETAPIAWGQISIRSQYALIIVATVFSWLMGFMLGLMGYIRSSVRLFWHVNEIMRDNSPWAFTHTIGFSAKIILLNTLVFWAGLLFLTWLARLAAQPMARTPEVGTIGIRKEQGF